MLAARIHEYGTADVFRLEEVPAPSVGPLDVGIAVQATSVNPVDYKIRAGAQRGVIRLKLPFILGMDVSGTVTEVGGQVTQFKVGDQVFASPSHERMGTYAEQVTVRAAEVALKPKSLSHVEAASLPLVALTAYDALVTACQVRAGQRVLIQAGSGGVGSAAVQIAKHLGAEVYATCSARNAELVRSLGADHVIDYTTQDFVEVARGVDAVLESVGGADISRAVRATRRGGHVAMITTGMPEMTARFGPQLGVLALGLQLAWRIASARLAHGVKLHVVTRKALAANLTWLAELADQGKLRPLVDEVFPLSRIADAHRRIETGRVRGKLVVEVRP